VNWAIVEVMGHRQYVGQIEETTIAGVVMLRVHIPEYAMTVIDSEWRGPVVARRPVRRAWAAHVVDLGGASLFAVNHCTEDTARRALPGSHRGPEAEVLEVIGEWSIGAAALEVRDEDPIRVEAEE
jgi:hypothetical protein